MSLDDAAEQYCSHIVFYFPFENFPLIIYTHHIQSDDSKLTKKTSLTKSQCVQVNYYNFNEKLGRTLYLKIGNMYVLNTLYKISMFYYKLSY